MKSSLVPSISVILACVSFLLCHLLFPLSSCFPSPWAHATHAHIAGATNTAQQLLLPSSRPTQPPLRMFTVFRSKGLDSGIQGAPKSLGALDNSLSLSEPHVHILESSMI